MHKTLLAAGALPETSVRELTTPQHHWRLHSRAFGTCLGTLQYQLYSRGTIVGSDSVSMVSDLINLQSVPV